MLCINSVHDRGQVIEIWGPGYVMTIDQEKDKKLLRGWIKDGKRWAEKLGEINNSDDWND